MGILLTLALAVWVWLSSRLIWGHAGGALGLRPRTVSRRQWAATALLILSLYVAAALSESLSPTRFSGEINPRRVASVAAFTLTFGPIFEEILFRGYVLKRVYEVIGGGALDLGFVRVSVASVFSGILFGLWHLPTPIVVLYFGDPLTRVYAGLAGVVAGASLAGILLGEIRVRTGSILPGVLLHLCANSIYVLAMASRLLHR